MSQPLSRNCVDADRRAGGTVGDLHERNPNARKDIAQAIGYLEDLEKLSISKISQEVPKEDMLKAWKPWLKYPESQVAETASFEAVLADFRFGRTNSHH